MTLTRMRDSRRFFAAMAIAAATTVIIGFGPTYYFKELFAAPPLRPALHVHAALFSAWIALFGIQTLFVASGRVRLHRRLGVAGVVLVVAMVISGVSVALTWARTPAPAPVGAGGGSRLVAVIIPLASVALFAALAAVGLMCRKRSAAHKRFMALATIALLPPALGRISFLASGGPLVFFAVSALFIVAMIGHDYVVRGRVHPVSLWGGVLLAASFPGRLAFGNTEVWQTFARWLLA